MTRCAGQILLGLSLWPLLVPAGIAAGQGISAPRFSARVGVAISSNRSVDADITGARELFLVVSGEGWGWANWAEPRLVGPAGELRLTDLNWKFASSGYGRPQVHANAAGDPQRIHGEPVPYGIGVHDPSLVIYDLPPGYTRFRARVGMDDAGRGPVTFMVYADCPFFDPGNPQLWQRQVHRELPGEPPACVETIGGDRLPGEVLAAAAAGDLANSPESCLLVRPHAAVNHPSSDQQPLVRVLERFVQRVVWQAASAAAEPCPPGSARLRSGAVLPFRTARFRDSTVRLLGPDGPQTIDFADLAELHLPPRDPWRAYCEELAVLSPGMAAPLLHVEARGGLAITASRARLRYLPPLHHDSQPMKWHLGLQPAWSLDMLWLPETEIIARSEYPPTRLPLARLRPIVSFSHAGGGATWPPRKNHSVRGWELSGGGQPSAWGFGVQAPTELQFPLPPAAEAFRTRVAMDAAAGQGGCAQARVFLEAADRQLLWESPLLIGSAASSESGCVRLPGLVPPSGQLVLQAYEAHHERPPGADPFQIRDLLNWLEPEVGLRPEVLASELDEQLIRWVPAWESWQIAGDRQATPQIVNRWDDDASRFRLAVAAGDGLTLVRPLPAGGGQQLRIVAAVPSQPAAPTVEIQVLLDGAAVHRGPLPQRKAGQELPAAILIPLADGARTLDRPAQLSVVLHATDDPPWLEWFALDLL